MSVHGMIFPAMTTAKSFENTEKDLLTYVSVSQLSFKHNSETISVSKNDICKSV